MLAGEGRHIYMGITPWGLGCHEPQGEGTKQDVCF